MSWWINHQTPDLRHHHLRAPRQKHLSRASRIGTPNKIFVAVVEFAGPPWSVIINQHTKVVGKTMNVKKYLLELQANPLMVCALPLKAASRLKGFRCMTKWVSRFSSLANRLISSKMNKVWRSLEDDIKGRWVLLDQVLSIPRVMRLFPEFRKTTQSWVQEFRNPMTQTTQVLLPDWFAGDTWPLTTQRSVCTIHK